MSVGGARENAGRPAGSVNRRSAEVIAKALAEGITPVEFMLKLMRDDTADPKERAWAAEKSAPYLHPRPAPLERTVEIDLPDTSTIDGIGQALDKIIQTVGKGEISPGEGQSLISVIEARRRVIETSELEERIAKLEASMPEGRK